MRKRIATLTVLFAGTAFAEKVTGYVPPSFVERFGRSFAFIGAAALILGVLLFAAFRLHRPADSKNWRAFVLTLVTAVIVASVWSAMDAGNDELWNPAFRGGMVLGLMLPFACVRLTKQTVVAWVVAMVLAVPSAAACELLLSWVQQQGLSLAW